MVLIKNYFNTRHTISPSQFFGDSNNLVRKNYCPPNNSLISRKFQSVWLAA